MERENYVRVSEILEPFSGMHRIPYEHVKNAGERGTKVHNALYGLLNDFITWEEITDDEIKPYLDSFLKSPMLNYWALEKRYFDDTLKLTGKVDAIIKNSEGDLVVLDFKTSSKPSKTWPIQLAAYCELTGVDRRAIIMHLQKDGKEAKIIEYDHNKIEYASSQFRVMYHLYKQMFPERWEGKGILDPIDP